MTGVARRENPSMWWLVHFVIPLAAWLVLLVLDSQLHLDQWVADHLFHLEGDAWALRNAPLTRLWLHERIKVVLGIIFLLLVVAAVVSRRVASLRPYRRGLFYLVAAMLGSVLIVSTIKHYSGVECPWDVSRYGGRHAGAIFRGIWPLGDGEGGCFPAGHASAGYCWLALYFFCAAYFPRWRWRALGFGLAAGLVLGLAQELRGAHFLSHDLWTLGICWFTAVLLARIFRLPIACSSQQGAS